MTDYDRGRAQGLRDAAASARSMGRRRWATFYGVHLTRFAESLEATARRYDQPTQDDPVTDWLLGRLP